MSTERSTILVTGGCGYIGTHTITCLLAENYNVVVADNLVNSSQISLDAVVKIAGLTEEERKERLIFHQVDIRDETALRKVFESSPTFQACIHFAGLKVKIYIHTIQTVSCTFFRR
jgi:UDP-glucose 4-epimerase